MCRTKIVVAFVFFVFVAVSGTRAVEDAYFSSSPKNVDVVSGKSVTLPCQVTPDDGVTYYWELNGSKIANTTRRYQQGSNLHITRVDREKDSGQFTCIAQDRTGISITSSAASLNVHYIDEVSVQPQYPESDVIVPGSELILRCHVDASGDVRYDWFRNAERLTKNARMEIKKNKLHIKSVNPSDNGVYRCTAQNDAGVSKSVKNFVLAVPGKETATIKVSPQNQIIKKGGTAYFNCVYENADVIEWYFKDTGPLESSNRITLHANGTLQIDNVKESDQGLYNCVGIRSESSEVPQSYSAELQLAFLENFTYASFEPPLFESPLQVVPELSEFQLSCLEPKSYPKAKKWWTNPEGHTISDSGEPKVDDDGRLIFNHVKKEHSGNYTCVAENVAGKTSMSIKLIVTSKPEILRNPESVTVEENREASMDCVYKSESPEHTTIRWKKDGKILKFSETSQRVKMFPENGTFTINAVKTSDRGEYICEIITEGFDPIASKPATISVIETLKFAPPPVNKKLELGSVAKIHCKAQGTPPPIVHWQKKGAEELPSHVTDSNGTLHFNGVVNGDAGRYTCTASNSQGVINTTITLEVVVAPKFISVPKNPTAAIEGSEVSLDCIAEGDPKPTIHWDKNRKMNDFDHARFSVLPNGTLYISEVHREDSNTYGCTAGSSAGLNRNEIKLVVHSKDGSHLDDIDNDGPTVTKAVLITMSVAGAYIILVIGLMIWCRYRRKSRKLPNIEGSKTENGEVEHTELKDGANGHGPSSSKPETNGIEVGQKSDGAETTQSQSSNHSKKSKSSYDKLSLSRTHLKEIKLIGRGEFGDVMLAKLPKSSLPNPTSEKRSSSSDTEQTSDLFVLIKALTNTKDETTLTEFKREIDMLSKLDRHDNVTRLLGLCREAEPHYMILEYTEWGDLKQFLVTTQRGGAQPLTVVQCAGVVHQVARGMEHLANARLVHKDLAARNCLVTPGLLIKVGMPRLSREPYSQEYCKHVNQVIPLRWMPYEAVYEDEYSTKSDVYAFGVLIWEVFSQGELPFPKLNDNSILNKLKEKTLEWKAHKSTPEQLQKLQEECWDMNPQKRPTFTQLVKEIQEILKSL